jgi:isocitrate dehydrogenase
VFDESYKEAYIASGLIPTGELQHLISDAATMQIIRWTKGGFGMAAHNYDGDMLTDEVAQVHRSPGFITSALLGRTDTGIAIKEFEASHGTVSDLWHAHNRGEETSMNPLGMVDALIEAMNHSAKLALEAYKTEDSSVDSKNAVEHAEGILNFTKTLKSALHNTFRYGQGTRDMAGPSGLTTEDFVNKVAWRLGRYVAAQVDEVAPQDLLIPSLKFRRNYNVDKDALSELFDTYDTNKNGAINLDELEV